MTTILQARPRQFVSTPAIERVAQRALRYLESGYSVHLRGPAGTGKTTLALHLADMLSRPMMMLFGDDEAKTSDLVGNQSGYTRKKVVDNFIHSVVKMEDEVRQNWVDSRLTLACREGFTLIYDEFNRSRPETNNVLLSALEEKLLTLPPNNNRSEYIRVHNDFRVIFTSNPTEYCGVHGTQDALLDRLITINMPEPDELTQQEIVIQKTDIDRASATFIVTIVKEFRQATQAKDSSGLRSCLIIAKICQDHALEVAPDNVDFRELCQDILLSRTSLAFGDSRQLLWNIFNAHVGGMTHAASSSPDLDDRPLNDRPSGGSPGKRMHPELLEQSGDRPPHSSSMSRSPLSPISPSVSSTGQTALDTKQGAVATLEKPEAPANLPVVMARSEEEILDGYMPNIELTSQVVTAHALELIGEDDAYSTESSSVLIGEETGKDVTALSTKSSSIESLPSTALSSQKNSPAAPHPVPTSPATATTPVVNVSSVESWPNWQEGVPYERDVYLHLQRYRDTRPSQIEAALGITRFQTVNALRSLQEKGLLQLSNPTATKTPAPEAFVQAHSSVQPITPKGEAS